MDKYFYSYYSCEELSRCYIEKRKYKCFGSFKNKSIKKVIIQTFNAVGEAYFTDVSSQQFYNVDNFGLGKLQLQNQLGGN